MGQPKLRPDAALTGNFPAGVLENPEPIAERFAHSTDLRPGASRPAPAQQQRPAKPAEMPQAPTGFARVRAQWPSKRRLLLAGSVLAALVPGVVFAAVWLGLRAPAEEPAPTAPPQQAESTIPSAVLTSMGRIEAISGSAVAFPIALDGTDGVPPRSVIAIKGLPQGSNLSEGRPYGDSEWTLRPDQIGDLSLALPAGAQGEFKLAIALIGPDDRVIAETETLLVASAPAISAAPVNTEAGSDPASRAGDEAGEPARAPQDSEPTAAIPEQQATEATAADPDIDAAVSGSETVEEKPIMMETASVPSRAAPPDQDPDAGDLGTVQPSVFVNMREGPSSSSPVLGVIAKGAELPVLGRKRGWVQVAHPETGKQGWIYSGLLVGETNTNHRVRRVAPADSEPKSESFWSRMGRWLSPSPEPSNAN